MIRSDFWRGEGRGARGEGRSFAPFTLRSLIFILLAVVVGVAVARLPVLWGGALVGGTAVFILIIIQPLIGLALTLLLGPLGALESLLFGGSSLDSGQVMLLLTVAAWLARRLSQRRLVVPQTRLNVPLFLFLAVTFVTLLFAPSLEFGLREWLKWVEVLLVMWLVVDLGEERRAEGEGREVRGSRGKRDLRFTGAKPLRSNIYDLRFKPILWVLGMLLLAGVSQAVVGIWQFGLRGDGPAHFLILGRFYRAYGTFEQPNPFGGFMNLSALLALGVFLSGAGGERREARGGRREARGEGRGAKSFPPSLFALRSALFTLPSLLIFVCLGLMVGGLVASWSRGAWLGFAGGTAVLILFWPRRRWQGVALLLVGGMLLWGGLTFNLLPAAIAERITTFGEDVTFGDARGVDINDTNYAVIERLAHWQAALGMAQDHFWLGVGFGNYEPAYREYALINWPYPLGHAHNYYLNLLAEVGVLGFVAYVGVWTAVFLQAIRLLKQHDGLNRGIVLGLLAVFAALAVHHLVDKLYVNNIYIHLGVMLGLLQLLDRQMGKRGLQSVGQLPDNLLGEINE